MNNKEGNEEKRIFSLDKEHHADILVHTSYHMDLQKELSDAEKKVQYIKSKIDVANHEMWEILHTAAPEEARRCSLRFNVDKMTLEEIDGSFRMPDIFRSLGDSLKGFKGFMEDE